MSTKTRMYYILQLFLIFIVASACGQSLTVTYGAKGVQTLSYGSTSLEDVGANSADVFHIWHMHSTDLNNNVLSGPGLDWGENNNGEAWNSSTNTETYTFSWGTISTQFVQSGNNLNMIVTETNNAGSGVIVDGAEIYPFALHFPQDPVGFSGYTQYAITTVEPGVSVADYGTGVVTSVIPNASIAMYGGWKSVGTNTYSPIMTSTAPDSLATFLPNNNVPVQPGSNLTYTVSLRFTAEGTSASASDAYSSFAATYPSQMTWTDKRIIGTAYLASSPAGGGDKTQPGGFPTNPRRYFNDSSVDITTSAGIQAFQNRMLAQASTNVTTAGTLSAQGVITWDIEGEEYPQDTSYVCSPDQIAQVAPEMEATVVDSSSPYYGQKLDDAYFKTMTTAGLKVGLCLRPQQFTLGANNTASQIFVTGNSAIISNLEAKARYANTRWGATIFYVDSTVDVNGGTLDPAIFQQINTDLPNFLFIPEETWPRHYAYTAPFYSFIFHTTTGTPASAHLYYPKAFGANLVNDVAASTLATYKPQLIQAVASGDILMGHADYDQANDSTLVSIYDSAASGEQQNPPPAVTVTIQHDPYTTTKIPGEEFKVFGVSTGGTTNQLTWAITSSTGGSSATLTPSVSPNIPGNYVDVLLNNVGSACTLQGVGGPESGYSITSAASLVLTATSVDNPSASASLPISVCAPTVAVYIPGNYETLYAGQMDEIEAKVWGAIDKAVTWTVAQPPGGNAILSDLVHNTVAFSATVAGRYTFTATSHADGSKSAQIIRYVSGVPLPYAMTPQHTVPVDCSIDPALTGSVYDIGPGKQYANFTAAMAAAQVPSQYSFAGNSAGPANANWIPPGTTIRAFNMDTSGTAPTRYHEYAVFAGQGTVSQPIRVLGCADSYGNPPIMDAADAISVPNNSSATNYIAGGNVPNVYYQLALYNAGGQYSSYPDFHGDKYYGIEGFSFRNGWSDNGEPLQSGGTDHAAAATPAVYFPNATTETPIGGAMSCIRAFGGDQISFRGNDFQDCTFGFFDDFNSTSDWGGFAGDINIEGNSFVNTGDWSYGTHEVYTQGWRQRIWNNYFGPKKSINQGILLKSRGIDDTISYNFFANSIQARVLDLVEDSDSSNFMQMAAYADYVFEVPGSPNYTPDLVATAYEAYHHENVYGNALQMQGGQQPNISITQVHFFGDQGSGEPERTGFLNFYYNTFNSGTGSGETMFDTTLSGDNQVRSEWPVINNWNNAYYTNSGNTLTWSALRSDFINFGPNWINSNWSSNNQTCYPPTSADNYCNNTGWSAMVENYDYMDGTNLPAHLTNFSNLIQGPNTIPFNSLNLTPTQTGGLIGAANSNLPAEMAGRPVRFQKSTTTYALQPRTDLSTLGAYDFNPNPPQIISITLSPASSTIVLGFSETPAVICNYDDGSHQPCTYPASTYTWSVSNSNILSVSSSGTVVGLGSGTASVTTTVNGMSSSQSVTVKPLIPMFTGNFTITGSISH